MQTPEWIDAVKLEVVGGDTHSFFLEMRADTVLSSADIVPLVVAKFKPCSCIFCGHKEILGTGAFITKGVDFHVPEGHVRYFFFSVCDCALRGGSPGNVVDRVEKKLRRAMTKLSLVENQSDLAPV